MQDYAFAASANGGPGPRRCARAWRSSPTASRRPCVKMSTRCSSSVIPRARRSAVSVLADLVRSGNVAEDGPELSLLTLGQAIPMQSFLPGASKLRADLRLLSETEALAWVDVSAPGDGCAFALCDPRRGLGGGRAGKPPALVLSAAFSQTLAPRPGGRCAGGSSGSTSSTSAPSTDPASMTTSPSLAGPMTLDARFRGRQPSRSRIRTSPPRATPRAPHDPAETGGPRGSGLALAVSQDVPCGYPFGAAAKLYPREEWPSSARRSCARFLVNTPELVREVLIERPGDFPKSPRVTAGLRRLLGNSVFVTNGETWARQRRIVEQCFGAPELRRVFPAMLDAGRGRCRPPPRGRGRYRAPRLTGRRRRDLPHPLFDSPSTTHRDRDL